MNDFQPTIAEFVRRLPSIMPVHNYGRYEGKEPAFPFAHASTEVEFSPQVLRQDLPGDVFRLSYTDCATSNCSEHEERMQEIVRECFSKVPDQEKGTLKVFFKHILFRKTSFFNVMSVAEVKERIQGRSVKVNARNECLVDESDARLLEFLENLGAVLQSEEEKADTLLVQFSNNDFHNRYHVYLDPATMRLSKITQRARLGKETSILFPSAVNQAEKISDGVNLVPCGERKFCFDDLRHMCTDHSLFSMLNAAGLGVVTKVENEEKFAISPANVGSIGHLFLRYNRIKYSFDLEGVKIVVSSTSGVNNNFERNSTETFVHQRTGRDPCLKFVRTPQVSVDKFVSVVARVIFALKSAVQSRELRLEMYDVTAQSDCRFDLAMRESPRWCQREYQRGRPDFDEDLVRIRNNTELPAMLGSNADISAFAMRARARILVQKIDRMRYWDPQELQRLGLDHNGHDLVRLKNKLVAAARQRNLNLV